MKYLEPKLVSITLPLQLDNVILNANNSLRGFLIRAM